MLNTWPCRGAIAGHKHAKRVLLPEESRDPERIQLDQEVVHDGNTFTEHQGATQLRELDANLPVALGRFIERRGLATVVDPDRTTVRYNIFVAPMECEVGLRVLHHVPTALGSTWSDCWSGEVTAMDVGAQTVTLAWDVVSPWERECLSVDGLLCMC